MSEGNKRVKGDGKGRQGGREKGTPNKINKEKRELISKFIDDHWDEFVTAFENLEDDKKCKLMVDLMPYASPKLASIEYKDKDKPRTFEDELSELSGENSRK